MDQEWMKEYSVSLIHHKMHTGMVRVIVTDTMIHLIHTTLGRRIENNNNKVNKPHLYSAHHCLSPYALDRKKQKQQEKKNKRKNK